MQSKLDVAGHETTGLTKGILQNTQGSYSNITGSPTNTRA